MPRNCINFIDAFCYIFCNFTLSGQRKKITPEISKIYKLYFGCSLEDQEKTWATHAACYSCCSLLRDWINKRMSSFRFAIPIIWREPKDHYNDCYFCAVNTAGLSSKNKHQIVYPNLDSVMRPVPHDITLLISVPPADGLDPVEEKCVVDV